MGYGKLILIALAITVSVALFVVGVFANAYNRAISLEEQISGARANVRVQEKKRFDLIGNLVDAAMSYAKHENLTLLQIAEARASVAKGDVDTALAKVNAVSEQYPELKADGLYSEVMTALSATEQSIANYRESYNMQVRSYEKQVRSFPSRQMLALMGYEPITTEYLEFEGLEDAPKDLFAGG